VSRSAALDRLSEIARPRTIRRALLVPVPAEGFPVADAKTRIEWPVPR
jgi:pyrimidine operon attenuation protein/uracil phosphoribosyltransferase